MAYTHRMLHSLPNLRAWYPIPCLRLFVTTNFVNWTVFKVGIHNILWTFWKKLVLVIIYVMAHWLRHLDSQVGNREILSETLTGSAWLWTPWRSCQDWRSQGQDSSEDQPDRGVPVQKNPQLTKNIFRWHYFLQKIKFLKAKTFLLKLFLIFSFKIDNMALDSDPNTM